MTNKMWGGRFAQGPAAIMAKINASIDFDKKLYAQDIAGSKAHANMLARQKIISRADAAAITKGLDQIKEEIEAGRFNFNAELEDIHLNIESRLKEIAGEPAGRLHTARSRNDQVATDFRLYVREAVDHFIKEIHDLMLALSEKAEANANTLMPGFTHLQSAQPITFGHHLLAYVEMLSRDAGRFVDARKRLNESPLGSAALAGTSYPIDRKATAYALGFDRPMRNSVDGVSARDFALEVLAACAICSIHLSRLAEEIVIWSSAQFRFIKLSDKFSTGSSIMPQKRNPDAAELIRAKPGRIMGAFTALAIMMKGLPLAYAKDMQEDKEQTFDALENFELAVAAMAGMVRDMEPNKDSMLAAANSGFSTATDLADWLVQKLKLPFRDAHHVTGKIVALAEEKGILLQDLPLADMRTVHPKIDEGVFRVLSVQASVASRTSEGGTAPANVLGEAKAWIKQLRGYRK